MAVDMKDVAAAVTAGAQQFPRFKTESGEDYADFQYGTAGFRMKQNLLDYVMFTVGLMAALRSRKMQGQTIGVMITASHNPAEDNGVKLVDPMGEMLEQDWESRTTALANARTPEQLLEAYAAAASHFKVDLSHPARVIYARDTRPSGSRLIRALQAALDAVNAQSIDYKILTTPQLHYLVRATNTQSTNQPYGVVSEQGYYEKLATAFAAVMKFVQAKSPVTVDCANGVGAPKLRELIKLLPKDKLTINIVNDRVEKPEVLNSKCGADFVKTSQKEPSGFTGEAMDRWASFDGDADRIIYYFQDQDKVFRLLDGDRIATLVASFIGELLQKSGLDHKIKLAVIQTAYANGASTKYINDTLRVKVECTATGVKHLHHAAMRHNIGVYFEANGHGTVLFSPEFFKAIGKHSPESPAQLEAFDTLKALVHLINQTVGDAMSDLLLVEAVLAHKEFTVREWLDTYTDLPNRLDKVLVKDRSAFKTVPGTAETQLASPPGVQREIDQIVPKYHAGRSFVRASGTEDAVRVYAEAAEVFDVEDMISRVKHVLKNFKNDSTGI